MPFSSAERDALFLDQTLITVAAVGQSTKGRYREAAEGVVLGSEMSGLELHPTILVSADALPGVTEQMEATIGARIFIVREIKPTSNGQFKRLTLAEKAL